MRHITFAFLRDVAGAALAGLVLAAAIIQLLLARIPR